MTNQRTMIAILLGLLLVVGAACLYFFGPSSEETLVCRTCGKMRIKRTALGVAWHEREQESDLSAWYQQVGMQPHAHQWTHLCSWKQNWGGQVGHWDSFGWELEPLRLLKEATERVDQTTSKDLVREYEATQQDEAKRRELLEHCDEIVGVEAESTSLIP